MAPNFVFALCMIFACLVSCQAKPENCSEALCKLLLVGEGFTAEFRVKASEKGVRMVYLNLKIGNDSYHPLESPTLFLSERWVWANSISEPMLSLPYDYDILSLGLLTYQERSMDAPLVDQPSGCLTRINLSCQRKVVARALLNNTAHSSDKTDVVCVKIIDTETSDSLALFFDGNIIYYCCGKSKEGSTKEPSIQCDLHAKKSGWFQSFYGILDILEYMMFFYHPALLLVLPDCIFSLREEYEKEVLRERNSEVENGEDNASFQNEMSERGANSSITGQDKEQNPLPSKNTSSGQNNSRTVRVCWDVNGSNVNPQICANDESIYKTLVFLDDVSPITLTYLFSKYIRQFTDFFSFNIKLAILSYLVIPFVFYINLGLNNSTKRDITEECLRKPQTFLGWQVLIGYPVNFFVILSCISTIVILGSRPKDFLLNGRCFFCKGHDLLLGEVVLKHLEEMQERIYNLTYLLIRRHKRDLMKYLLKRCCKLKRCSTDVENDDIVLKRIRDQVIVNILDFFQNVIIIAFFGLFLGALYFCVILVIAFIFCVMYSPLFCLVIAVWRKCINCTIYLYRASEGKVLMKKCCFLVLSLLIMFIIISFYFALIIFLSIIGASSCRFIVRLFGFVIMGLVLNAEIASPFVTFLIAVSTNMYLCYYNLQMRYQDVKQMISEKWQEHKHLLGDSCSDVFADTDTIPLNLFWHICGTRKAKSEHKVLPVWTEIFRVLRNMALILVFLVLSLCSIIFLGDTYNVPTVVSTIAVFVSGVIPGLFFKGLTKGKRFSGPTRKRMIKKIEKAVKDYIQKERADSLSQLTSRVISNRRSSAPS